VDVDTGAVLDAHDEHLALPPASLTKILTALTVVNGVTPDATVPASTRAEAMPARKINMKAGQVWSFADAFHAMMLSSANDAAVALAERADGTVERFSEDMARVARDVGLRDNPVLQDPAGLDDAEFSVNGGNLISARDLAITTRAALANPVIAEAVADPLYKFHGPDGADHKLGNHNQLLKIYPGAIGVKTGYTKRAGQCLIAAARRDGRTMLAVVLHAPSVYANSTALLDRGFATPVAAEAGLDHLPAVREPARHPAQGSPAPAAAASPSDKRTPAGYLTHRAGDLWDEPPVLAAELALAGLGILRLRALLRNRRRRELRSARWASESLD
jgi:D-alanyl-D-alanine carboxypeptidase (penicillin-binding protein 5/6)